MERYVETMLYLWTKEPDFREKFASGKGFCLYHLGMILDGTEKYLTENQKTVFMEALFKLQLENMERINEDINWFTKKFDYLNRDSSWKNSHDAVPRSIQKIVGYFRKES